MIKEAYVSFEVAKLLKEKGFNESIFEYYVENKDNIQYAHNKDGFRPSELPGSYYPHITQQMARAWLREVHNKNIDIVSIWNQKRWEYQIFIITPTTAAHPYVVDTLYMNYEEAVDIALKHVLINLI